MPKKSGLGSLLFIGGRAISNDVRSFAAKGGPALIDVTGIDKSAYERIGALRDGGLDFVAMFNDDLLTGSHAVLSALPTADTGVLVALGQSVGSFAGFLTAKQVDYPLQRAANGELTANISTLGNGTGVFWGEMLTAGLRTESVATNGSSIDFGSVSTLFGLSAIVQVTALTSGTPTVKIQDSADNITFADVTGGSFGVVVAQQSNVIQTATGATIRRYVRVITSGTFSGLSFACAFIRHPVSTI